MLVVRGVYSVRLDAAVGECHVEFSKSLCGCRKSEDENESTDMDAANCGFGGRRCREHSVAGRGEEGGCAKGAGKRSLDHLDFDDR
jgi:hypothetical protein